MEATEWRGRHASFYLLIFDYYILLPHQQPFKRIICAAETMRNDNKNAENFLQLTIPLVTQQACVTTSAVKAENSSNDNQYFNKKTYSTGWGKA